MPPNLLRKSVPPTSAGAARDVSSRGPDSRPATRPTDQFSTMRTDLTEAIMTYQTIGMASDRVLHSLATGSGIEDRRTLGNGID